jgi:hypothetical protein
LLGGLTLRDALCLQLEILFKAVCSFETVPVGLAVSVTLLCLLNDGCDRDLLGLSRAYA